MKTAVSNENWWKTWAPYWERLENRHLSTAVTDTLLEGAASPALVVGAGQGLIVERLRERGLSVEGVDLEPEMIAWAKRRRGIDLTLANAAALPYRDGAFRTVIIATGVLDYVDDEALMGSIVQEAKRVLEDGGELVMTFYKLAPRIERINRGIGVLTSENRYCLRRIFEIMHAYKAFPLAPVPMIAKWTDRNVLSTALRWTALGMSLPSEMRREQKDIKKVFASAPSRGLTEEALIASVPESLPYRDEAAVRRLVKKLGVFAYSVSSATDCTVIRHHRCSNLDDAATSEKASAESGGTEQDTIIRTTGLTKVFAKGGLRAVDGLSIRVRRGTIYGILGPNGAGKTTTLAMLCGLVLPTEGEIVFSCGLNKESIEQTIGYVPQKLALYERLTALDNLRFFGALYGVTGRRFEERSAEVLDIVGLRARAREPISNYSGGMLRRLNLAVGLLHEPKILLLDEPTVGIDPQSRNRIFDAVLRLRERGVTVLYTTHYMEEAMTLCDTIAIMDHGKVVLAGAPTDALNEFGLSEIRFVAEGVPAASDIAKMEALPGVRSVSFTAPVLTVRAEPKKADTDLIRAVRDACDGGRLKLTLKCFLEPTLERLFLDITGRSLRDERERS